MAKDVSKQRITQEQADKARSLLTPSTAIEDLSKVDFVIEAVPEIPKLKFDIFSKLAEICPKHAILATNTSSISKVTFLKVNGACLVGLFDSLQI